MESDTGRKAAYYLGLYCTFVGMDRQFLNRPFGS